jgi:hypothetical protein
VNEMRISLLLSLDGTINCLHLTLEGRMKHIQRQSSFKSEEGVCEVGTEVNIWTEERRSDRRLEKTA